MGVGCWGCELRKSLSEFVAVYRGNAVLGCKLTSVRIEVARRNKKACVGALCDHRAKEAA
jgi:hypothetical protein